MHVGKPCSSFNWQLGPCKEFKIDFFPLQSNSRNLCVKVNFAVEI
jgi:hypothetical protein